MSETNKQPLTDPNGRQWDPKAIFFILDNDMRRTILFSLARGPRTASQISGLKLGAIIKHLEEMIKAGLVIKKPNPEDGRRPIYSLMPEVHVVKTDAGVVEIDFGVCLVRS